MSYLPFGFGRRDDETPAVDASDDGPSTSTDRDRTPSDVFVDTGLTPEEFVVEELRASDGPISQQALCRRLRMSDSTVSMLLSEMERAGTVARIHIGAEKVIYLPDAPPAYVTSLTDEDDIQ